MKMRKNWLVLLTLILSFGMVLAACGGTETKPAASDTNTNTNSNSSDTQKKEDTGPKKGGTVTFAMFSAPAGVFNPLLYEDVYESNVLGYAFNSLFEQEDDLSLSPELASEWSFSEDKKILTVKLQQNVTWHDGEKFTADDVVYTYSTMAHPEYTGTRSYVVSGLQGYDDFHGGKTKEFAGVKKVDDYTVEFHMTNPLPNALENINFSIVPEHVYSKYPVKDLASAPESTTKPIGTGPFKFGKMVVNEFYELDRNDNYFQGAPLLDKIVWKIVNQDVAAGLLETGEIDVYAEISPADIQLISDIQGIKVHEVADFGYQYVGFKLNTRPKKDVEGGVFDPANYTPNQDVADVQLRQAIAYAIDRQGLVQGLLDGHGTVMNAPMPPVSWAAASESEINTYPHSTDKAKEVLAAAGYKDTDGDGFVEKPDGSKLVLNLDFPTGNKVREKSAPVIAENLKAAGINVNMKAPRDVSAHYDAIDADDESLDMFLAGWGLSTDPDPSGIWLSTDKWNFPRWNNQESDALIKEGLSLKAFDQNYRREVYVKWQKLVSEQLPYVFLYSQNSITAYNERIQDVKAGTFGIGRDIHLWWVKE
jgi:peptide/nickel transport system substrate-binding protein